jgi:hypothetical protein
MTRQRVLFVFIGVVVLAALIGAWSFRRPFLETARADLQGRGLYWFDVLGTRIPCHGPFDIGVSVVFQNGANGEFIGGRLCRPIGQSSQWNWYPDPAKARAATPGK